jgi:cytochrome b561
MAAMLLAMVGAGLVMARAAETAAASGDFSARVLGLSIFEAYQLHKSVGVVLFALVLFRLVWRLTYRSPELPSAMPRTERLAALGTHAILYALMLTMPLTGWLLASASPLGIPTLVFGVLPLPHPIGPDADTEAVLSGLHLAGGLALLALAGLHVAAALKHHFIDRDDVLRAMLPSLDLRRWLLLGTAVLLLSAATGSGPAEAQARWVVVPEDSAIGFTVNIGGSEATGGFETWTAAIVFDPETPASGTVEVAVDTASVFIDAVQARSAISGPDWLAVRTYAEAQFSAVGFDWNDAGELVIDGTLTLLGTARPLTLSGRLDVKGANAVATVSGTVERLEHGIGDASPAVSQEVTVTVTLTAIRSNEN